VITAYKETVRCAECGQDLSTAFDIQVGSRCPKCSADLHTCRNCRHFDTGSRFECSQPIKERIGKKSRRQRLPALHRAHDRRQGARASRGAPGNAPTPGSSSSRSSDEARAALERLFKK